jgi:hypothetical protein
MLTGTSGAVGPPSYSSLICGLFEASVQSSLQPDHASLTLDE